MYTKTNSGRWAYSLPVALVILAPFNLLASLGMDIYLPIIPAMPGILGTTPAVVQLTLTLYMIMLGVGQVVFGPLSDSIGRRPVLLVGSLIFAITSLSLAMTSSPAQFVVLRLLQGVGASAMLVALFATIRDVYADKPESVVIYGLMNSMLAFVPALGPIAGALISQAFGWRGIFLALGVPALVALFLILPVWPETRVQRTGRRRPAARRIFGSVAFWTYTTGFGAAMGSFFVFLSTAPRLLMENAGFSELEFSLAFSTVAFVMIGTTRFARNFIAAWGIRKSAIRGMNFLLVGALLLFLGQFVSSPSFLTFVVPMWVIATGIVITASVTANGALAEFNDVAGTAVALHFCIQSIIVGVVGTMFVVVLDGSTEWPLITYVTVMAGGTLVALYKMENVQT